MLLKFTAEQIRNGCVGMMPSNTCRTSSTVLITVRFSILWPHTQLIDFASTVPAMKNIFNAWIANAHS